MFENRVLRRILGPKREEVAEGWRRLHNEELHNLYVSPSIIRIIKSEKIRWERHIECVRGMRNSYSILVWKIWREIGRPRRRWEDIRMGV
jgi:hypothetical protein